MSDNITRRKTLSLLGVTAGALTVSGLAASNIVESGASRRGTSASLAQQDERTIDWRRTYDTGGNEVGNDVVVTADGFAFAGGGTTNDRGSDAYLVETDEEGNLRWSTSFGGDGHQVLHGLVAEAEGYVLCGSADTGIVIGTDREGAEQWRTTLGVEVNDISKTADGGYAVAGRKDHSEDGAIPLLGKLATDGSVTWTRAYEEGTPSYFNAVVQTPDGGYALAGYALLNGNWTLKTDSEGNRTWGTAPREGQAMDVSLTADGDILSTGNVIGDGFDPYLTRFAQDGTVRFSKQYADIAASSASTVHELPNGEFVLSTSGFGLLVTDRDGTKQWFGDYDGHANALAGLDDGSVVVTGRTASDDADAVLVKTRPLTALGDRPTDEPTEDDEPAEERTPTESSETGSSTPTEYTDSETPTHTTTDSDGDDGDCTI